MVEAEERVRKAESRESSEAAGLSEDEKELLSQFASMASNLLKSLLSLLPRLFAQDPELLEALRRKLVEKGRRRPTMDDILDIFEDIPDLTVAKIESSIRRLPLVVRLSMSTVQGIAQSILKVKPEWREAVRNDRENLILTLLKVSREPQFTLLADSLEKHPRTLKAITNYILMKLGA